MNATENTDNNADNNQRPGNRRQIKYPPEYVPLLVLGYLFQIKLQDEGMGLKKFSGAHCRSAESIRTACKPYHSLEWWHKFYNWAGWIIWLAGCFCLILTQIPAGWWCVLVVLAVIACIILHYLMDPQKLLTEEMKEFLRIEKLWKPVRKFYLESDFVGLLTPSFHMLSKRESTQLGINCLVWVTNHEFHKMRSALRDVFDRAIIKMAYEVHIAEMCSLPAVEQVAIREGVEHLLHKLLKDSFVVSAKWTVGTAMSEAIERFGVWNPEQGKASGGLAAVPA